jgi:hypothetical protein
MLCVQAPTWEVNPTISAEVFQEYYAEDPRVFYTEFGAEFTDRTLGWLEDPEDLFACIDKHARPRSRGQARRPYFMGFDLGLVNDASAMAIVHINEENKIVLDYVGQIKAGEGEFTDRDRLEFEDVAAWIQRMSRMFNIRSGLFDQWNAIPLEQALAKKGLQQIKSEHMSAQKNSEIYQILKSMIWDKRLVLYDISDREKRRLQELEKPIPEHLEYIQQLLELQAEYKSKYVISVQAPQSDGKHDDYPDALSRAVYLASQQMGKLRHIAGVHRQGQQASKQSARVRRANRRQRMLGGSDPKRQIQRKRRR